MSCLLKLTATKTDIFGLFSMSCVQKHHFHIWAALFILAVGLCGHIHTESTMAHGWGRSMSFKVDTQGKDFLECSATEHLPNRTEHQNGRTEHSPNRTHFENGRTEHRPNRTYFENHRTEHGRTEPNMFGCRTSIWLDRGDYCCLVF